MECRRRDARHGALGSDTPEDLVIPRVTARTDRPLIAAVTGTNGKTTVAHTTRQLMRDVGWGAAGIDSLGITDTAGGTESARIRRSARYYPETIAALSRRGAEAISLEAYVGVLADGLLADVEVDVAVCTGLERDHLDVHGSIEAYWGAKLTLFSTVLRPDGIAIIATDGAQGDLVREAAAQRGATLVTVGDGGDVRLTDARERYGRLEGHLVLGDDSCAVSLASVHAVTVTNMLLAAAAVAALGAPLDRVATALSRAVPPPGRLETVAEHEGIRAVVDSAHNPAALRAALRAVRAATAGRLIVVLGAGGERDREKRPLMGACADELADLVILTDDNPRREPPERIRREVRAACPGAIEIPRRSDAIAAAVLMARGGDTILVAGKGNETEQIVGTTRIAHDDRVVLREAMASLLPS